MGTINAEERLEVLDNGSHLGWTNVANGKWKFSSVGLTPGVHNFTAEYKGKRSAAWRVNVEGKSTDDFAGETENANATELKRPKFIIRRTTGANPATGGHAILHPHTTVSTLPGFKAPVIGIQVSVRAASFPNRRVVVEFVFDNPYSIISFDCMPFRTSSALASTSQVQALKADGSVETQDSKKWPDRMTKIVNFGVAGQRAIKSLRFTIDIAPGVANGYEELWLNSITMTP
ncbi:hypothetical protein [Pseudomonas sp. UBA1879]|uniref:hypothetical protein n=1 Tax=Pseudomonas sp. UBA1879 TaxID=1947305 RepID=UPI0025F59B4E|nr:hypothetical protein [Pseudomonas sp. UBA1879]